MAKKSFEWTTEQNVGMVETNERERRLIKFCSLDLEETEEREAETRWYISIVTMKFFKKKDEIEATWKPVKNATFPLDTWFEIVEIVNDNVEFEGEEE